MGEENNIFSGQSKIVLFNDMGEISELGEVSELGAIVEDSAKILADSTEWEAEEDDVKSISAPTSYSFQCEIPQTEEAKVLFSKPKCFEVAEGLLEDLQKLIKAFRTPKISMNRRERRAKEREITKKHKQFVTYCKAHNITIGKSDE